MLKIESLYFTRPQCHVGIWPHHSKCPAGQPNKCDRVHLRKVHLLQSFFSRVQQTGVTSLLNEPQACKRCLLSHKTLKSKLTFCHLKWASSLILRANRSNSCYLQAPITVPCSTCVHLRFISMRILQVCLQQEQKTTAGVAPLSVFSIRKRGCALRLKACATFVLVFHAPHGRPDYKHKSQKFKPPAVWSREWHPKFT